MNEEWASLLLQQLAYDLWQKYLLECQEKIFPDIRCSLPEIREDERVQFGVRAKSDGQCPTNDEQRAQLIREIKKLQPWHSRLDRCQVYIDKLVNQLGDIWGLHDNPKCHHPHL